jgi:hypothetical protein
MELHAREAFLYRNASFDTVEPLEYRSTSMSLMRRQPFRVFPLLFGTLLLLWQLCLVYHQTEHTLQAPDETCLLCQAADHMQHGLPAAAVVGVVHFAPDLADTEPSVLSPQFLRPPSARGPPSGRTA